MDYSVMRVICITMQRKNVYWIKSPNGWIEREIKAVIHKHYLNYCRLKIWHAIQILLETSLSALKK